MSLTRDESKLMEELMSEDSTYADMVKEAGDELINSLGCHITVAQDDRRAALDVAIYRYVLACGG